jgi:HlyD family secretion protein
VASFIEAEAPVHFVMAPVSRGPIVRAVEAKGIINPEQTFLINPVVSGTIQDIFCDVDMQVKKDQLCAKINRRPYQDAVDRSKADLAVAQAQLVRDEAGLAHAKINSERDLRAGRGHRVSLRGLRTPESASSLTSPQIEFDKATIQEKEASFRAAEDNLDATSIVSLADGTVISRNIAIGQMVAPSTEAPALFTIAGDLGRMKINAGVAESNIGGIKLGDRASFTVDTYPNRSFESVVLRPPLVPRMVGNVVTYDVVLEADNSNLLLKPGMIAAVQIITARRSDVLRVPDQAFNFRLAASAHPPRYRPDKAGSGFSVMGSLQPSP